MVSDRQNTNNIKSETDVTINARSSTRDHHFNVNHKFNNSLNLKFKFIAWLKQPLGPQYRIYEAQTPETTTPVLMQVTINNSIENKFQREARQHKTTIPYIYVYA